MALVTRYFSTTAAGAGDGTTWADRAALFSAGVWSTVITGFAFNGSDAMEARIEGGLTYTQGAALTSALFTNAPTAANPLTLIACDSSGDRLADQSPGWKSPMPLWDVSLLPTIATTTNIQTSTLATANWYQIRITASGRNGDMVTAGSWNRCVAVNSTSHSSAMVSNNGSWSGSYLECSGTAFVSISGSIGAFNCRFKGNASATSGNRDGLTSSSIIGCTVTGATRYSVACYNANAPVYCTIVGGSAGIYIISGSSVVIAHGNLVVNSTGWGVGYSTGGGILNNTRLRDNTSGNIQSANTVSLGTYDTDSDDATEFVDSAGGDYRIKYGAPTWGTGVGAGDGPATITG